MQLTQRSGRSRFARLLVKLAIALGSIGFVLTCVSLGASPVQNSAAAQVLAGEDDPSGHEADEGPVLGGDNGVESVRTGERCAPEMPVRQFSVVAINVQITLNRYLDYDPDGRMYVLEEDLPRVRQEEAQNRMARAGQAEPAVTIGEQGDAIQPLTLRVTQGECVRIDLRNDLSDGQDASLHLHGSSLRIAGAGTPAVATNRAAMAGPGQTVSYEWMVEPDEPEGTHYFHSHGDSRDQTNHGLFGAVIVEPRGATFADPLTGGELRAGWQAMIRTSGGSSFREMALYYHEIGDERYRHLDRNNRLVAEVDPYTSAYRPGDRAINYRSEPFMNRLALQQQTLGTFDKSVAYSSYAFGDPATPIARSYLGDPMRQRVIHGGSEVFHVHHVHGGAIRWPRQPSEEPNEPDVGLDKHPPLVPQASERVDSQSIGPSETYDIVDECGSGGCQQSAGDYMFHCHVAAHYLGGMWGIWRVYNTRQDGTVSGDAMPPLPELPDRVGGVAPAITSDALANRTVDWKGRSFGIDAASLNSWVERQLPPRGVPQGYDAAVLNWSNEGARYLNEPETEASWPGYRSATPGTRPPILVDPLTGKLAYPLLRPHLGRRPPFAPNHGPAPFLEPMQQGTDVPQPGENGPWSLCPAGATLKPYGIMAIAVPVPLNTADGVVDPSGSIYVLKDREDATRSSDALKVPLAIRANAGQDCVDILLRSKLEDGRDNAFLSKVDLHVHFVQFDVQGSDGVDTGFNYEQSVRPFTVEGEKLLAPAHVGSTDLKVNSTARFQAGILVGIGMDQDATFEVRRVREVQGTEMMFDSPLKYAHTAGEIVSTEFVRYRWYPDVQFGTAYFHDHVDALHSWRHGLFGAIIAEPPGSTYRDPHTGAEIQSGELADIHTDPGAVVSADVRGSFREAVMFLQDDNPLTHVGGSSGGTIGLRAEPLAARAGAADRLFSSTAHGDPATPLVEAYPGDPVVFRTLVAGSNDVHTWHLDGHWFRLEPYSSTSPPIDTVHIGISERYDLVVPKAGGRSGLAGDYLYYDGRSFKLREGLWGIFRVLDPAGGASLQVLPGRDPPLTHAGSVCPAGAPLKNYAVAAIDVPLPMLAGALGKLYVLQADREATLDGSRQPEPLVVHVNVGDCVHIQLANETRDGPVSIHADLLDYDPKDSGGIEAGLDPPQVVAPGQSRMYTYYADPDVGETTALLRDWGNVLGNPGRGLYGAIVVGPRGTRYTDPVTGADLSERAGWRVDAHPAEAPAYRDFSVFMQDEDEIIGTAQMPYTEHVAGVVGLNYRSEPLLPRLASGSGTATVFSPVVYGDPSTPLLEAFAGDPVRLHVLVPFSEQAHVFSVEGHRWPLEPGRAGTDMRDAYQVGGLEVLNALLAYGAGGRAGLPGDYLYGDHREPFREAGLWGLFRVHDQQDSAVSLMPLQSP